MISNSKAGTPSTQAKKYFPIVMLFHLIKW